MNATRCLIPCGLAAASLTLGWQEAPPAAVEDHPARELRGWTVRVDRALLESEGRELGERALELLAAELLEVELLVPAARLDALKAVPIWIDREHELERMQFHPSAVWLEEHGYDPRMERSVHIPRAASFLALARTGHQPSVVLHELAHAFHFRELGFDHPPIRAAFEAAAAGGAYDEVLHVSGRERRHYALTDPMEYFAEATEAFFGTNDFYPFVRAELRPVSYTHLTLPTIYSV